MHGRLDYVYNASTHSCNSVIHLSSKLNKTDFTKLLNIVEKAYKSLHKKGSYSATDIESYRELIYAYNEVYTKAIDIGVKDNLIPAKMRQSLQNDAFIFSHIKTHAQLLEVSSYLLENDKVVSFDKFAQKVDKINANYNRHYLQAEYQFAVRSAQQAANWNALDKDDNLFNLQYRTANDEKVRDTHRALHDVTLPASDPFWSSFYPPNGWNCRCRAVEVRKNKYEVSDSLDSMQKGLDATVQIGKNGENKLGIFRFNPGMSKVIFPPDHPYKKVIGSSAVIRTAQKGFIPQELENYTRTLGVEVDTSIFKHLVKPTPLITNSKVYHGKGAFYLPSSNFVHIPIDKRRRLSKWYAEAVVYHEFGHAIDHHHKFRSNPIVKDLMSKWRKRLANNNHEGYKDLDNLIFSQDRPNKTFEEKLLVLDDTLMSLHINYGSGHTRAYYKMTGASEAEFIAHAFSNKYAGNEVFEKLAPELYRDMINMVDELLSQ